MQSLPITAKFVIESPDQRESLVGVQLRDLDMPYVSVPGTFYDNFPKDFAPLQSWAKLRRYLSLPEIGCAESHMECYRRFLETEDELALIFEDDARISNIESMDRTLSEVWKLDFESKFCVSFFSKVATLKRDRNRHSLLFSVVDVPTSAVCYAISRGAAKALLEANKAHDYNADWPKNTEIQFYLSKTTTIETGGVDSLIGHNRGTINVTTIQRVLILASVFCGAHYIRHKRSFQNFKEYRKIMIRPTLVRTKYRLVSFPLSGFPKGVRISIWS